MSKDKPNEQIQGINEPPLRQENDSLLNLTRQELFELAKNLSKGKYKKDSRQRDNLMQLLVKQLSGTDAQKGKE